MDTPTVPNPRNPSSQRNGSGSATPTMSPIPATMVRMAICGACTIGSLGDCWVAPGRNGRLIAVRRDTNRVCAVSRFPGLLIGKPLVAHKIRCLKLLAETMYYQSRDCDRSLGTGMHQQPAPWIRNKKGKMVQNRKYSSFKTSTQNWFK